MYVKQPDPSEWKRPKRLLPSNELNGFIPTDDVRNYSLPHRGEMYQMYFYIK